MDLMSSHQEAGEFADKLHGGDHPYGKSSHAFRTISEVSEEIDVPQHVLRFWESKFPQIRPLKRGGGRRYYRPEDIELLKRIKNYLYNQGYTIKGVQRLLKEKRSEAVQSFVPYASPAASLPGFPFNKVAEPAAPPITISSYLQAAAAAPSALAMAYGAIGGQIAQQSGNHHFGDAFEQSTAPDAKPEENPNLAQIERTLEAVTQIHSELATPVQPIRIANPSAPTLEELAEDVVQMAEALLSEKKETRELEFNFETTTANAAPQQQAVSEEEFEADEFNQDEGGEDVPVKRLDEFMPDCMVEEEVIEETFIETTSNLAVQPIAVAAPEPEPAPAISLAKKHELLGVLAEMMELRDMLRTHIIA